MAAAAVALSSCNKTPEYDASGNFEATDVTISAETAGRILEFNVSEGDTLPANRVVALIDTAQLHYQRQQLLFQYSASNANRPDISLQLAATRRELQRQQRERKRIENLLADGAATTKQLDDINAAIQVDRKSVV